MANLRHSESFEELGLAEHPAEQLVEFYLINGYRLADPQDEQKPHGDADGDRDVGTGTDKAGIDKAGTDKAGIDKNAPDAERSLKFMRGKPGNGWWTSNMAELFARVDILCTRQAVHFEYDVQTTGQLLSEADRAFWGAEPRAAMRYVRGLDEEPRDLQAMETSRSKKVSGGFLSVGIWGGVAVFLIVVLLGLLGIL